MIKNKFCFRYGKAEPERILTVIHGLGPITIERMREHLSKATIEAFLPMVLRRNDAATNSNGELYCRCAVCEGKRNG